MSLAIQFRSVGRAVPQYHNTPNDFLIAYHNLVLIPLPLQPSQSKRKTPERHPVEFVWGLTQSKTEYLQRLSR